jgi:hypothetical protein
MAAGEAADVRTRIRRLNIQIFPRKMTGKLAKFTWQAAVKEMRKDLRALEKRLTSVRKADKTTLLRRPGNTLASPTLAVGSYVCTTFVCGTESLVSEMHSFCIRH